MIQQESLIYKKLFQYIQDYNSICIFHHERADYDALGSSFALKLYIEENYNKKVYIVGNDAAAILNKFPHIEPVSDDIIANSLAIILDTANAARIDDNRIHLSPFKIKIDHHINVDNYADFEIVDDKAAATCEILAKIFYTEQKDISQECAHYLYLGLLSDTINFTTRNTTSDTLFYASYIAKFIDNISAISRIIFEKNIDEFKYENFLKSTIKFDDNIAYVIIDCEYLDYNVSKEQAKEMVYVMANLAGVDIWALFMKMRNGYGVSLRSKEIAINELAKKYGGGGHRNACGIKDLPQSKIPVLINELKKLK